MNQASQTVRLSAPIVDALDTFIENALGQVAPDRLEEEGYCRLRLDELRGLIETASSSLPLKEPLSIQLLRHIPVTAAGDVGIAGMTAQTLGEALDTGVRFLPLVAELFDCHKRVVGNEVRVEILPRYDLGETANAVLIELFAGLFGNMAFFAKHAPNADSEMHYVMRLFFSHGPQGNVDAYVDLFGAVPEFGQSSNYFVIGRRVLGQALLTSNRATHTAMVAMLEERLHRHVVTQTMTDRLRQLIWQSLMDGVVLTTPELASRLCMSPRTLSRRLEEEGTNARQLLDQTRLEYARRLAQTSTLSVLQIAHRAGYSNASSFSRAFRRHFGVSPGESRC
ncbi:helix-turn-helix domain-containing protein [Alcanivorax sp.]|jgi:AraC-like DNA-binding protein|uniref:helix-turn-helix transcriptional regulator n=1 Tax=Alcanivorax sp. TaxID=1872427 RepID=UPI0032D952AD